MDKVREALDILVDQILKDSAGPQPKDIGILTERLAGIWVLANGVKEALATDNWQSIETAPKDGKALYGYWYEHEWYEMICTYNEASNVKEFTHWQSLPNPPKGE